METLAATLGGKQFSSPEEELAYLREHVRQKEKELEDQGKAHAAAAVAPQVLRSYAATPAETVLTPDFHQLPHELAALLDLLPEAHDVRMEEFLALMETQGIRNVLTAAQKMNDPHLEDDLHRFLVQYIRQGFPVKDLEKSGVLAGLRMTLYEITLPNSKGEQGNERKTLKELVSGMEQFYAGMLSVADKHAYGKEYLTLEVAVAEGSQEVIFYAGVPDHRKDLFEKQIVSIFSDVKIQENKEDYNIFHEGNVLAVSRATLARESALPIKTYDQFDYDPLNFLLNSFSKISQAGEGAALQIVLSPAGPRYIDLYKKVKKEVEDGMSLSKAMRYGTFGGSLMNAVDDLFTSSKKEGEIAEPKKIDSAVIEGINKKLLTQVVDTNIRILVSSQNEIRAKEILSSIESSFNQFEDTQANKIVFNELTGRKKTKAARDFSFRIYEPDESLPLNLRELTTVFHLPGSTVTSSSELKEAKSGIAPAPVDMPTEGIILGVNKYRGKDTMVYMSPADRLRHFYVIGQTGSGKSGLLKNMIAQDIAQGNGVCFIDPHGVDVLDVLKMVPPERYNDVIYFDPAYTARPFGLNMLEFDPRFPEQKTFVVNEMLAIFNKLFDMKVAGGPAFEQYFRNSALLVMEDPESGSTLLEIARVLGDKEFRAMKLSRCKNPIIKQFWKNAEQTTGDQALANFVPYITNKFDNFLTNEYMRPIIAQQESSFNFREIMDSKKILLVNLGKGRLGDLNANLIGLILVGKMLMAALSRVDVMGTDFPPFYLYIDEFHNITADSISTILSEARKYKLSLTVAHQFIKQLDEGIKDAVFGNVGSMATFRVGAEDAEFLEKQYAPVFKPFDIMNLDNRSAYLKLLVNGKPAKPFNIETLPTPQGSEEHVEALKELSYVTYGRDRAEVESEIMAKYERKPSL